MEQATFNQKQVMPEIEKAETEIKRLIILYLLLNWSRYLLIYEINRVLYRLNGALPLDMIDRNAYLNGMSKSATKWVIEYYDKPKKQAEKLTPNKAPKEMWSQAKAYPKIEDYKKKVEQKIIELANEPSRSDEAGKRPISLWQKSELEIRHEAQNEMLDELKRNGVEYAYLSSHPNCSKRCEKWQGKLVSLTRHANYSGFRVEKTDGIWAYSLIDIMAQTDKYGYHNNIISGFNCRHKLIPYVKGKKPPREFSERDIKKQRELEEYKRYLERKIRSEKKLEIMYNNLNKQLALKYKRHVKKLTEIYKNFCEKNGFAYEEYRLKVR